MEDRCAWMMEAKDRGTKDDKEQDVRGKTIPLQIAK